MNYKAKFSQLYNQLNQNQKKAVDTLEGPVLVIAGPGTGKTQVLTTRIANILDKTDTDPTAILALTFTESGVNAMKSRLIDIIGETAYKVDIFTFHAFATNIIQTNPNEFIIGDDAKPLSDIERVKIFREIFDNFNDIAFRPTNSPYYYVKTSIDTIKKLKQEFILPDDYQKLLKSKNNGLTDQDLLKNQRFLYVYQEYNKKLAQLKRYDYEDMINFVIQKFKSDPNLLAKYQERYQYFLVDEFQDTNNSQSQIVYLLADYAEWQNNPNLFIVGDDDQSIYRFQGASAENITNFITKYPNAAVINLLQNYRSSQLILDSANQIIKNNTDRICDKLAISKNLISNANKTDQKIDYGIFTNSYIETYYIANKISELIKSGVNPDQIAVIYRNNYESSLISEYLSKLNVKYRIAGGDNILNNGIILRLINLLYAIKNIPDKTDDQYFFNVVNYEFIGLNPLDVLKLCRFATDLKINLFEAIDHAEITKAQIKDLKKIADFRDQLIRWHTLSFNTNFTDFIYELIDKSGYLIWLLGLQDNYRKLNILNTLLNEIKNVQLSNPQISLAEFLQNIELMREFGIMLPESELELGLGSVNLMTAHKSKGLEFEYVFIPYFTEKKWSNKITREYLKLPTNIMQTIKSLNSKDYKQHEINDERRLFYVALTRAKQKICITLSQNETLNQSDKQTMPSIFITQGIQDYLNQLPIYDLEKNANDYLKLSTTNNKTTDQNINKDEKEFLTNKLKQFKLSATTYNRYLQCPYNFKLEFLFNTPKVMQKHLLLGQLIHKVLENCNKIKERPVELRDLLADFEAQLAKSSVSKNDISDIQIDGKKILTQYYQTYTTEFTNNKPDVILAETKFGKFRYPIKFYDVLIDGRMDKVVAIDRSQRIVQIVDYKTGKPKTLNTVKGKTKASQGEIYNQMLFYLLLAQNDRDFNYKVQSVLVDFVGTPKESPKRILLPNDQQMQNDLEEFKVDVKNTWDLIKDLKFERTKDTEVCKNCRFKEHCWPDGIPVSSNDQLQITEI